MAFAGKRRVLILVQNLPVPFDRRVWLEATTLASHGYDVSVICPKMLGYDRGFERLEGIDIYRYPMPIDPRGRLGFVAEYVISLLLSMALSLRVALAGRGFDVIHACNPPETAWLIGLFWKLFGKRYVFDHHDLSPELYDVMFESDGNSPLRRLLVLMEKASFAVASVAIATNESHKRVAVERGGMDPDHVFVVRSAPDLKRLSVHPSDPAWRKGKTHLVAYLGEMGRQDGVDNLVRALHDMRHRLGRDDFHAVFIGSGTHRQQAIDLAAKLGIADICTFTGIVSDEDLCRILSSADLGVDPVDRNAWSDKSTMNKIMEYMFFGLPVVAFDLSETRVSAGAAGAYAEPGAIPGLADEISALLDDEPARKEKSEEGRRRLVEELSWEHSVPHLLAAYENVFNKV